MKQKSFTKNSPGRLETITQPDKTYLVYVPNPLPPKNLTIDLELLNALSDAASALGELKGLGRKMANPQLLINPFLNREAVLSSKIEGTQSDISDLYAFQAGQQLSLPLEGFTPQKPKPPESDTQEVNNYVKALYYGLERLNTLPVSKRLFCELHKILLTSVRGEKANPGYFRDRQVWIGGSLSKIEDAEYVPPPPEIMQEALNELENYIHKSSEYPPLIRVGMIHYQFEAIHPFIDGNGRIGRLLIILLLVEWGVLPLPLLYLSAFFERNRDKYLDLLQSVSERGKWKEWLIFFLQGVTEESLDAGIRAKKLEDLQSDWSQRVRAEPGKVSGLTLQIIDYLFKNPVISAPIVQDEFHVSNPGARNALNNLVEIGILRELETQQRTKMFYAQDIIRILL